VPVIGVTYKATNLLNVKNNDYRSKVSPQYLLTIYNDGVSALAYFIDLELIMFIFE